MALSLLAHVSRKQAPHLDHTQAVARALEQPAELRILLVGNAQGADTLLRHALWDGRYTIDIARDIPSGYTLATRGGYDLIVLDLPRPAHDGPEMCRHLRAAGVATSILLLSARGTADDIIAGLDAGADVCLASPVNVEELRARVGALWRRRAPVVLAALHVGDLTLDLQRHEARRSGRVIPLGPEEYALLKLLVRHSGRVVTRTEIAAHLWGNASPRPDTADTVDAAVTGLRDKVNCGLAPPLIVASGNGYTIEC